MSDTAREAAESLWTGLGRRDFVRAVAALSAGAGVAGVASACSSGGSTSTPSATSSSFTILQTGQGEPSGDHYLQSTPDQVLWGYVPNVHTAPAMQMASGETVTIDTVSHEGVLEDQGRDPLEFFGLHGVADSDVLADAIGVAADYTRTPRNFDKDGPHVVTGPVFVEGAQPGDVLKIEILEAIPRVPYGVVSSRHGKGALARQSDGGAPEGIAVSEVMPPVGTGGRSHSNPALYGNVSTFTTVVDGHGIMKFGDAQVRHPHQPLHGDDGGGVLPGSRPDCGDRAFGATDCRRRQHRHPTPR